MSDTPRTDDDLWSFPGPMKVAGGIKVYVRSQTARQLERELNAANERIKRLEEAGKELRECASWVGHACCEYADQIRRAKAAVEAWDKEAKP